ncbi:hypothetical protein AGR7A_Lc60016 [Agrobacterium deltaense NCPPB 1641]|uniref:Uncharacterized protein n=1 Tax=Agrobacterium deltaense NCPPB 1641 TaxID=1183425 RepID=A0A1S7U6R3_9HYPH|nr:hypothetical protein AGR7A_Lc60016 [Agrobacterium deltaense NCPPB 1641]
MPEHPHLSISRWGLLRLANNEMQRLIRLCSSGPRSWMSNAICFPALSGSDHFFVSLFVLLP